MQENSKLTNCELFEHSKFFGTYMVCYILVI